MNQILLLTIISFIALIVGAFIIKKPIWGLFLFTFMLYVPPASIVPQIGALHITRLLATFLFLIVLLKEKNQDIQSFKIIGQTKLFLLFILFIFLSNLTSVWRSQSISLSINFMKVFIAYFLIIKLVTSCKKLKTIIWAMIIAGAYIAIFALRGQSGGRLSASFAGMFANANDLALCFVIIIPFSLYLLFDKQYKFKKIIIGSSLFLFTISLFKTESRGAFIGCALMGLFIILKSKKKVASFLTIAILSVILFHIMPTSFRERILTISTASSKDGNTISRIDAWKAGFGMMKSNFFGVGIGNFSEAFVDYRATDAIDVLGKRRAAHNAFVQVGGELGILGLFIFIALINSSLKSLSKIIKALRDSPNKTTDELLLLANATYISLISFCATAFFLSQAYNWILYYLIAFSAIIENLSKEKLNA